MVEIENAQLAAYFENLRQASRHVRESATLLGGKADEHLPLCAAAGDHHQGWETTEALYECAEAWASHLRGHAEHSHGLGHKYHRMSGVYADADLASQGNGAPPPHTEDG